MSDINSVSSDVNLKDLHCFISVATAGSFRSAAAQLYTSQPAVSRAVARLEYQLGVTLLDRGPRGAQPTTAGQALLIHARKITALVANTRREVQEAWTSTIHLGAAATAAGSYLAPFLAEWVPSHPNVRIQVLEDGAASLRKRLEARECDLAIIAAPIPLIFEARPITWVGIRAHFPAGHPLDTGEPTVDVDELATHPLLVNNSPFLSARVLFEAFDTSGIHPQVRYQSANGQTLAALAEAGMGVAAFGDSVDLRATALRSRGVVDRGGHQLGFDLHIAWPRTGTPEWVREFGMALSEFTAGRVGVPSPQR